MIPKKKDFIVRVRETVIAEYTVEARDGAEALDIFESDAPKRDRMEIETVDWEVERVGVKAR